MKDKNELGYLLLREMNLLF